MVTARAAVFVAALAVSGALVLPSGATPMTATPADRAGDISLHPHGEYARLLDGDLLVDLSATNPRVEGAGVNEDAVTTVAEAFRVRHGGERAVRVWVTHDAEALTVRVGGDPIESPGDAVTLRPSESVAVDLTVDSRDGATTARLDGISIHTAPVPERAADATDPGAEFDGPTIQTRAPSPHARAITVFAGTPGETYDVDTDALVLDRAGGDALTLDAIAVENAAGSLTMGATAVDGGSARAEVAAAGADPLGAVRVDVTAGAVEGGTLRFAVPQSYLDARGVAADALAVYRADGGDLSRLDAAVTTGEDGRVRITAPTSVSGTLVVAAARARLRITDAGLNRTDTSPGAPVVLTATVVNDGAVAGKRVLPVTVNGTEAARATVTAAPGETATVTVPLARDRPGEYVVAVAGVEAGTFAVEAPSEPTARTTRESAETTATATMARTDQSPTETPTTTAGPSTPTREAAGFGLGDLLWLLGTLAVVAAALLARRLRRP